MRNKRLTQRLLVGALRQAEQKIRADYADVPPPRYPEQPELLLESEIRQVYPSALGVSTSTTSNTPANPRASQMTQATPKLAHRNTPSGNHHDSPASTSSKRQGASPSASSSPSPLLVQSATTKRKSEPGDEPMESSTSSSAPRRARASTTATNVSDDSGPAHGTRATNKRKPTAPMRHTSGRKR